MSAVSNPTTKLPSAFHCYQCDTELDIGMAITKDAALRGWFKGHILVCGHCGAFMICGDSTLERMTVAQFRAQPLEMQRLMGLTRRQIEMRNKGKAS